MTAAGWILGTFMVLLALYNWVVANPDWFPARQKRVPAPVPRLPAEPDEDLYLVTYRAVAGGLRPEVREAIELSMPCTHAADGQHLWMPESETVMEGGWQVTRIVRWWQCTLCHVSVAI